ncbi:MAG: calcium-binding protein, partial [Pseudomonadota bacterium]
MFNVKLTLLFCPKPYGGSGADEFVFGSGDGYDWIMDFSTSEGDWLAWVGGDGIMGEERRGNDLIVTHSGGVIDIVDFFENPENPADENGDIPLYEGDAGNESEGGPDDVGGRGEPGLVPTYIPSGGVGGSDIPPIVQSSDPNAPSVKKKWTQAKVASSPLVLDLDADGIELSNVADTDAVYFDLDHNGTAEATGFAKGGDGLLAIDINEDGIINNGGELFGDQTGYGNGFLALAQYDTNSDSQITSADTQYENLLVWVDANQNGYSESGELNALYGLGITAISTGYTDVSTQVNGNDVRQAGTFTMDGNTRDIKDVYFTVDTVNTVYNEDYTLDPAALFLPTMRGYGELPDLHIAMSLDNTGAGNLLSLMQDFSAFSLDDIFTSANNDVAEAVRAVMYRWAGVDGVDPDSRGAYADAPELGFLEKMMGEPFLWRGVYSDPTAGAGLELDKAFNLAFNHVYGTLVAQTAAGALLTGDYYYNIATDAFEGVTGIDLGVLADLEAEASGLANTALREALWGGVVRMIEYTVGTDNLSGADQTALDGAITASDATLDLADIIATLGVDDLTGSTINGTGGADILNGGVLNDLINGINGNDTLTGGAGIDTLAGGAGDDTLIGGTGGDYLLGSDGNDTYSYALGDGEDEISDTSGTDKISFGAGIDSGDLAFERRINNDLLINIDTGTQTGQIIVDNFFDTSAFAVETILFDDASTLTLTGQQYTTYGTAGSDTITGIVNSGSTADIIYGGDGNDMINGATGDDTLTGGAGNDTLVGVSNNDTYVYALGDGDDT